VFFATALLAQYAPGNLETALGEMKCHTVLLAPMQKIVDPPRWSPDSKSIAFKLDGKWVRCDLDKLQVKRFKWRNNQDVAAPQGIPAYAPIPDEVWKAWSFCPEEVSRAVKVLGGPQIDLLADSNGGVSLRFTHQGGQVQETWTTRMEDCQALCLSPDQKWVAFLCGSHGIAVMRVPLNSDAPRGAAPSTPESPRKSTLPEVPGNPAPKR
jgi:hypothetical protein